MVDEPAAEAAFEAAARFAAAESDVDVGALALAARTNTRDLWYAAPTHLYCLRVGISSWEGLWCRFEGDEPNVRRLRSWAATYRLEAWRLALLEQGVEDAGLAEELGMRFGNERRARHQVFDDVVAVLRELRNTIALALLTNGASCLQREKLAASGLQHFFRTVVVSADLGVGKPDAAIFRHTMSQLGSDTAVMVGDSLSRDADGAIAAGLQAYVLAARPPAAAAPLLRAVRRRQAQGLRDNNSSGASRARTGDLLHAMQALSQLSYSPL